MRVVVDFAAGRCEPRWPSELGAAVGGLRKQVPGFVTVKGRRGALTALRVTLSVFGCVVTKQLP